MKTTDFDPSKKYVFVVPAGSTEQHGPFLPLGTDSFIQDEITRSVESSFEQVIFLPALRVSCSEEHEGFPGTVWISKSTMRVVLKEVCESLKPYARLIVFVTAHGGNVRILTQFVEENEGAFPGVQLAYIELNPPELDREIEVLFHGPSDMHAGNAEISMMMSIESDLVTVPPKEYPKKVVRDPFQSNRLKDFCENGIADNHPLWIIDEELGRKVIERSVREFREKLSLLVRPE